jgi:hypothetical protein
MRADRLQNRPLILVRLLLPRANVEKSWLRFRPPVGVVLVVPGCRTVLKSFRLADEMAGLGRELIELFVEVSAPRADAEKS